MGTIDTLKDFYGDIADDWKKAWDDLLDRDDDDDLPFGLPAQALAAMPGDTLRTLATMSLLQDDDKKKSSKNKNRNMAALALLSGTGGAAQQQVAGLDAVGDLTQRLGALPQQIQQLSEVINVLVDALRTMEPLLGAAGAVGAAAKAAARK